MKAKSRRLLTALLVTAEIFTASMSPATVMAGSNDYLGTLNTGIAAVLDGDLYARAERSAMRKLEAKEPEIEEEKKSDLVMANVQNALNVRAEADENSEKVGVLYIDCGGRILERKDGWTKLRSGNLEGWARDEYLLFDDDAEKMASEVGNLIVTVNDEALRVRKEPAEDAGIYGILAYEDELIVIEELEDWISIDYMGDTGYISKEYATTDFHIDAGETMEEIAAREKIEAEEKAKRLEELKKKQNTENRGAVAADVSDELLLAALIQCEAGNQSYEGQVGVGAVVMNRVRSGGYPNTISGVIYASGQFPPALSGKVARVAQKGVKESCIQAARAALAGETTVGGSTRFKRADGREGIVIGSHVFW